MNVFWEAKMVYKTKTRDNILSVILKIDKIY